MIEVSEVYVRCFFISSRPSLITGIQLLVFCSIVISFPVNVGMLRKLKNEVGRTRTGLSDRVSKHMSKLFIQR